MKEWLGVLFEGKDVSGLVSDLSEITSPASEISPGRLVSGKVRFLGGRFWVEVMDQEEGVRVSIKHREPELECDMEVNKGLNKVVFKSKHHTVFEAENSDGGEWKIFLQRGWGFGKARREFDRFMVSCDIQAVPVDPLITGISDSPQAWHYLLNKAGELARKSGVLQVHGNERDKIDVADGFGERFIHIDHNLVLQASEAAVQARHVLQKMNGGRTLPG